ncbi:hypothetical protein [Rhodococcus sp. NBC_00297]|uniref:hypothetical protein n=1 Tax=Rhodococcus sp. NBC_00297 TaxID=2976005 RepID=UPI002E2899D2|nr:hypothetical protein [Rhodococcus sp. NBC_00297]
MTVTLTWECIYERTAAELLHCSGSGLVPGEHQLHRITGDGNGLHTGSLVVEGGGAN